MLIPAVQTQSLDKKHVPFSTSVYAGELAILPADIPMVVFSMALTMEDVLLHGIYQGILRVGAVKAGVVEVDWVYHPKPPALGQVYPSVTCRPVPEV